jgi:hypothetical protein
MKLRPIIFSGEMVRAILDGRKTQTRRVVKPQPTGAPIYDPAIGWRFPGGPNINCPYGVPGDRLWVRETWGYHGTHSCGDLYEAMVVYHADGSDPPRRRIAFPSFGEMKDSVPSQEIKAPPGFDELDEWDRRAVWGDLLSAWWKRKRKIPSIHMFKWASRITLEVTGVRVERVQEISQGDAVKEGLEAKEPNHVTSARYRFGQLWNSIHTKPERQWEANPWVWCVEFRRVDS